MTLTQALIDSFQAYFDFLNVALGDVWWWVLPPFLAIVAFRVWKVYLMFRYMRNIPWVLLSISVPKLMERGPRFAEQMFTALWSIFSSPNWIDRNWAGKVQDWFSFEIVGIDGQVQFLVRAPKYFADHVKSQIYAQYADAEIKEVEDYVEKVPEHFLEAGYDVWGTEFELLKPDAYPIRTYPYFPDREKQVYADPVSAILSILSRLDHGEQVWLQLVCAPTDPGVWAKDGAEVQKELKAKLSKTKPGVAVDPLMAAFSDSINALHPISDTSYADLAQGAESGQMQGTPGEVNVLKAVEINYSKHAFNTTFRMIYVAKKEVFSKPRGVAGPMGAIQQFNTGDLNGFKPNKKVTTNIDYFFKDTRERMRKIKIMKAAKLRWQSLVKKPFKLSVEELATIWHFPEEGVKTERLQEVGSRKISAPSNLPVIE